MESRRGNRRRRLHKRQTIRTAAAEEEASDNEESPPLRQKRPPQRKKRIKEPIYQEDIVDGFAFLCFKTYEDLERTVSRFEKKSVEGSVEGAEEGAADTTSEQPPLLEEAPAAQTKKIKNNKHPKVKKNNCLNSKVGKDTDPFTTNNEKSSSRTGDKILETARGTSKDRLSDASSHASLERGYMCDSESGDERGSEPECDLFNSTNDSTSFLAKKTNPGHSQACRSPPVLPPVIHPVQNGAPLRHPEPSIAAVAAVTASASPTNTSSTMTVAAEPQVASPASVVAVSTSSSPPPGTVPTSSPLLHPPLTSGKESASSGVGNKLLNNGYKFVSDTSVPSREVGGNVKPATINVYDFVSDQSDAPSSPEGGRGREVLFLSQKFHHKGLSPSTAAPSVKEQQPPGEKVVGNGLCALSPPVLQNCHKSALDMTVPSRPEQTLAPSASTTSLPPSIRLPASSPLPNAPTSAAVSLSPAAGPLRSSAPTTTTVLSRCSPVVTSSHPNTPTPVPARDTHSSHSNSSLSSLSQLSGSKDTSRSHSNPGSNVTSAYASAGSLAGLVFSKPHCWSGSSSTTNTVSVSSSIPPRTSPALSNASLPLPPSLPTQAHHTSPFGAHPGPPPPPLLPVAASHHAMFPAGGHLTPTMEAPSGYRGPEALFAQPSEYKKHPDLLRRELDTRFLASQDHSIPIPPPPYMQSEMHQQAAPPPFMAPPSLGNPMVSQNLYDKYPKLDSSLYRRPSIGLSGYPTVSALFAPGGGGASTPFVPPAHLAALQSKINSVPKTKSMKPGKWCAMHVRIAWEIYNLQQKQRQVEAQHKVVKPPEHLHHHPLFSSMAPPRQHDPLSPFSTSLISAAAASAHPRSFESSSHPSTFLNPTPAHLGPFTRPGYAGFPGAAATFTGLGPLGLPGATMLGTTDPLRSGCLPQDPWGSQRGGLGPPFGSPWGGLKEEAEREQRRREEQQRQKQRAELERREKEERERREQERREQERRELERQEQERKEKERREQERREQERREQERREQERREQERREQERQRERDRELRLHHQLQKSSMMMNGEHHHLHHAHHLSREWERSQLAPPPVVKYESSPLERHHHAYASQHHLQKTVEQPVKIKQERRDESEPPVPVTSRSSRQPMPSEVVRKRNPEPPPHMDPVSLRHTLGLHGMIPSSSSSPAKDPLWGPLTPSPTVMPGVDHHYRTTREMGRPEPRFDPLTVSPELQRHALDHAYDRAKLLPPPALRTSEASPYAVATPPASASSFFSPPVSPYLGGLVTSSSAGRAKAVMNGLPPPLIPCTFPNHTGFSTARAGLGIPEAYFAKERRGEVNGHAPAADFDAHLRL